MTNVVIIQARCGSTRLPDKVLYKLGDREVISWVTRSAERIPGVDLVVVATSETGNDDRIENWCNKNKVECFRGSETDVLARIVEAGQYYNAKNLVRITADCPFIDPYVCGEVLIKFLRDDSDYVSNCHPITWPDGLDCEVVSLKVLSNINQFTLSSFDREHVTSFITSNQYAFKVKNLFCPIPNISHNRWTLDYKKDLQFLKELAKLIPDRPPAYTELLDVLNKNKETLEPNVNQRTSVDTDRSASQRSKNFYSSGVLLKRAKKVVPLGSQTFSKSYIQYPKKAPMFLTHGEGGLVWDVDGNRYVDLVMGLLPIVLGYCDQKVGNAITEQLARGITFSLATELEVVLAEKLTSIIPSAEMVRFGKNGTDATSAAVRLARAYTQRDHILVCGYHGWQDWYIGSTSRDKGVPKPVRGLTHSVPFNDLSAVKKICEELPDDIAAMIVEPANVEHPNPGYFQELRSLLKKKGILLIFDEVITGFRFALGGAQSLFEIEPDLSCFGKGMGNGMPISAVVGRSEIMTEMENIFFSGTFGGEALSIVAALAVIDRMENEPIIETIWSRGAKLADQIIELIGRLELGDVVSLSGFPPWKILSFKNCGGYSAQLIKTLFIQEMLKNGVLINSSHNICFSHTEPDLLTVQRAYVSTLEGIKNAILEKNLEKLLDGPVIQPVFKVR